MSGVINYRLTADAFIELARQISVGAVQLRGSVPVSQLGVPRSKAPTQRVAKSLIIDGYATADDVFASAMDAVPHAEMILTDNLDARADACGAAGLVHAWGISAELARGCTDPLVLARGLNPYNVGDAITSARPAAVAVHTGVVGSDGRKRSDMPAAPVARASAAFALARSAASGEGRVCVGT